MLNKPSALKLFQDHNQDNPWIKHIIRSEGKLKAAKSQEKIDRLDGLFIKGINKFETEIEAIKRIPEEHRYIIENTEENKFLDVTEDLSL